MPSGVVSHCRLCLLVWCLTLGHIGRACWSILHFNRHFDLVECRGKRDGYKSGATLTEVPLHQTCLLFRCHSQTCLLVQCNSIRHACWVHLFRYTSLQSASLSGKNSGMLQIHQTCLQVMCESHRLVKLNSYQPGRDREYIKF